MKQQIHLTGRGFSGRAVRYEPLDPDEAERNLMAAAKLAGPEASGLEIKKLEWRNGLRLFVVEVSEKCTNPQAPEVKWKKASPGWLDNLGDYFTTKDIQALEKVFCDFHEVMPSEIEAITGKAISLSED